MTSKQIIRVTLVVTSAVITVLIVLLFIGLSITIASGVRLKRALQYATTNQVCIGKHKKNCLVYIPDDTLLAGKTVPVASVYSSKIARCATDLILRLATLSPSTSLTKFVKHPGLINVASFVQHRVKKPVGCLLVDLSVTFCWLVFRGTGSRKEWRANLDVEQVSFKPALADTILVHKGFYDIYMEVRDTLMQAIEPYLLLPIPIYVTGHSMGAALAAMATLELAQMLRAQTRAAPHVTLHTYTFAPPRVGNDAFRQALVDEDVLHGGAVHSFFQIINIDDIVFSLPLAVTPNVKAADSPWQYKHMGTLLYFSENWGSWKTNHTLPIYIANLNNVNAFKT